jgi:hypothetical protein
MSEPFDDSETLGAAMLAAIVFVVIVGAAFVFKVWNERQMTHEYHEQAVQERRIADAPERAYPPSTVYVTTSSIDDFPLCAPPNKSQFYPCTIREKFLLSPTVITAFPDKKRRYAFADCILAIPSGRDVTDADMDRCSK